MRHKPKPKRANPYGSPVKPKADGIPFPNLPLPEKFRGIPVKPQTKRLVKSILTKETAEAVEIPLEKPVAPESTTPPKEIEVVKESKPIVKSKQKTIQLQRKGRVGANDRIGRLDFAKAPVPKIESITPEPKPEPPKIDKSQKAKHRPSDGIDIPEMIVGGDLEPEPPKRHETDRIIIEETDYDDYEI